MTAFVDTAVIMYAGGAAHPRRRACQTLIEGVVDGRLEAVTSTEVVQEIFHRFAAIDRRETGVSMAEATMDIFVPLVPITDRIVRRMPELVLRYPRLSARDLLHVATCLDLEVDVIISPDRGFDEVDEVRRIDPGDAAERLL